MMTDRPAVKVNYTLAAPKLHQKHQRYGEKYKNSQNLPKAARLRKRNKTKELVLHVKTSLSIYPSFLEPTSSGEK